MQLTKILIRKENKLLIFFFKSIPQVCLKLMALKVGLFGLFVFCCCFQMRNGTEQNWKAADEQTWKTATLPKSSSGIFCVYCVVKEQH